MRQKARDDAPGDRSAADVVEHHPQEARGRVTINSLDTVETMHVEIFGLPADTELDVFLIQVPTAPFGLAWYQGDIETGEKGQGVADFVGRFSRETLSLRARARPLSSSKIRLSRMPPRTRRPGRSSSITWGSGSARPTLRPRPAAPIR